MAASHGDLKPTEQSRDLIRTPASETGGLAEDGEKHHSQIATAADNCNSKCTLSQKNRVKAIEENIEIA